MYIISKFKDYYDYLAGIYGIDKTLVYDRRATKDYSFKKFEKEDISKDAPEQYIFYICNKKYVVFEYKHILYHTGVEIIALNDLLIKEGKSRDTLWFPRPWTNYYSKVATALQYYSYYNRLDISVNAEKRVPILLLKTPIYRQDQEHLQEYYIPNLKSFSFHKHIVAEDLYQEIYAFLSWMKDYPEISNNQTDDEKRHSHGFDKRYSFRHRPKSD